MPSAMQMQMHLSHLVTDNNDVNKYAINQSGAVEHDAPPPNPPLHRTGQHHNKLRITAADTCSFSLDIDMASEQHKAGLLYECLPVFKVQQLGLSQVPCQLPVLLLCSLPTRILNEECATNAVPVGK